MGGLHGRAAYEDYLKSIYCDTKQAGRFSGPHKLHKLVQKEAKYKLGLYKIKKWLQNQEPYSLHRPVRHHFTRNTVIVTGINDQWEADLADMSNYAKDNDGYKFVLAVIDVFLKNL